MTRIWINKIPIIRLDTFIKALEKKLTNTNILRTEQILLPNTEQVFSGYLLLIPSPAGKKEAMNYVLKKLGAKENIVFGDALVDVSMLKNNSSKGYALNPTPLARKELEGSRVTVLEGSPPANLLHVMETELGNKDLRNSPYRSISEPVVSVIEPFIYPKLTPNQLSLKGLEIVRNALLSGRPLSIFNLIGGYILDLVDGVRARKNSQTSDDGQLYDVYSDRMKEVLELQSHGHFEASLSCFLPSIARAQAEAINIQIPEHDSSGGSALSRAVKLIRSYMLYSLGNVVGSNRVDNSIYLSNIQTFENRKSKIKSFSWSKLKDYDRKSVTRLLFLINLLQTEAKKQKVNEVKFKATLKEYLNVDVNGWKKSLNISFPQI